MRKQVVVNLCETGHIKGLEIIETPLVAINIMLFMTNRIILRKTASELV